MNEDLISLMIDINTVSAELKENITIVGKAIKLCLECVGIG